MSLDDLLNKGWIKPFKTTPDQVQSRLNLARRDIRVIYDVAGAVSLQEAKAAFQFAENFVKIITQHAGKK